jgi:hypothetical protein
VATTERTWVLQDFSRDKVSSQSIITMCVPRMSSDVALTPSHFVVEAFAYVNAPMFFDTILEKVTLALYYSKHVLFLSVTL